MIDPKILDDIAERLSAVVPESVTAAQASVKQQMKTALTSIFNQLDMVTREEFDVQKKVLERTREKVDLLEKQLLELEKSLK